MRALPVLATALTASVAVFAAEYKAPAGTMPAMRRPSAESILPGGRKVSPLGKQHTTGPGPFGLAVSPDGRTVVSADGGPNRYSITVLQRRKQRWNIRQFLAEREREGKSKGKAEADDAWRSVFMGLAFEGDSSLYASEGNSGRIRLVRTSRGKTRTVIDLNQGGFRDSFSGDLALDPRRQLLYAVDQANFRVAVVDAGKKRVIASVRTGRLPFAITLSPDGRRVYVTNAGMFEYQPVPGIDLKRVRETGLPFPAFGFPSPDARNGARRETAAGPVEVPGLGDPNVRESNSLCAIQVADPKAPRVEAWIRTGLPFGGESLGGSSPSGVVASADRIFVSNAHNDSVTVIDARSYAVLGEIPIRIPGLETLRGVLPLGLAFHQDSGWLLAAEAGINAIAVIDTRERKVLGHIPAGWFPTQVRIHEDTVYVTNAKGQGTGPNADRRTPFRESFQGALRRGSIQIFPLPGPGELAGLTARVMALNGLTPAKDPAPPVPEAIRYVVLIVKENRTFDEVLGDIRNVSNGAVRGAPALARFGRYGWVRSERKGFQSRFGLRDIEVAPNHRELAQRWAFSDNFYADSEVSVDGHHWLVGSYPNAWTESTLMAAYGGQKNFRFPTAAPGRLLFAEGNSSVHPEEQLEAGALWHHLERSGISFRNYGEGFELAGVDEGEGLEPTGGRFVTNVPMPEPLYRNTSRDYPVFNMNISDQYRASQFIAEIEKKYVQGGEAFPRLLYIHLPNDHMSKARPGDGYPFEESFVVDNDYALGRIVEYLSGTPWWRQMAILVTEDDAQGGVDHIDSHRTVLLVAGPYVKRNYVSRVNSSFPGLLKTVFRILEIPPLNLFDAIASDLSDCFTSQPDFTPYKALTVDPRLFEPEKARDAAHAEPSPRMDDPRVLEQQHQR